MSRSDEHEFSLLTIRQAATRLSCSPTNVYALIEQGELAFVCVGRAKGYRIDTRDIERFIEQRKSVKPGHSEMKSPAQPKLKHIKF